jgi:hypothetical protein
MSNVTLTVNGAPISVKSGTTVAAQSPANNAAHSVAWASATSAA